MGTIKERKMFLNKMAEQTIVEFKHAKKYFKSVCVRRKGKQKEKKKTHGETENKQRKRNQRLEEQTNTQL